MSSFSIPPLSGGINFDISQLTGGMSAAIGAVNQFPNAVRTGIDDPLEHAGHNAGEIGEHVESGMMAAEAAMQLFPPLVIELIENPMLGAIAVVKEFGAKVGEIVGEVANHFEQVNLAAIKLDMDPAVLSEYGAAAKECGVSFDTLQMSLKMMQDRAANALRGDQSGIKGFEDLGIGAKELQGLLDDPQKMILRMADAMVQLQGTGKLTQGAMESLGRQGTELLPFLLRGADGIQALAEKHKEFGASVGADEAELGATWQAMSATFSSLWEGIETKLATPVLKYFSDNWDEITGTVERAAYAIGDGVVGAMQMLGPIVETSWGVVSGLGDTLGGVIMPLLEAIYPLLKLIGEVIKGIMDSAAVGLNGFAGGLHLLMGDTTGAQTAFNRGTDAANRFLGDVGSDRRIPTGDVKIENVNVYHEDGHSSSQVAAPIQKAIADAKREWSDAERGNHVKRHVAHSTGARWHGN